MDYMCLWFCIFGVGVCIEGQTTVGIAILPFDETVLGTLYSICSDLDFQANAFSVWLFFSSNEKFSAEFIAAVAVEIAFMPRWRSPRWREHDATHTVAIS